MAATRNLYFAIYRIEQARGVGTEDTLVVLKVVEVRQYCVGHRFESRPTLFLVDTSAFVVLLKIFNKMRGMKI